MKRLLVFGLVLLVPHAAQAACVSIVGSGLAFGGYTGLVISTITGTVTLQNCTASFGYSVGLNTGLTGGAVTTRKMTSGGNSLSYALYRESARTTNWGNTKGTDAVAGTSPATAGSSVPLTVYGTLTALQYPTPGAYTDTITATAQNSGSQTGSFTVTATVVATCTISTTNLVFGNYSGLLIDSTSSLSITCTNTTPYNVGLSAGNSGGTVTNRKMRGPSPALASYSLYRDIGRSTNWGQTVGTDTVAGTGTGVPQALTVYGEVAGGLDQIAAGNTINPGSYTDTVVATVTY
jgi:spore coat protein U-like protein